MSKQKTGEIMMKYVMHLLLSAAGLLFFSVIPAYAAEATPDKIVSAKDSMVVVMPYDPGSLDPHSNIMQGATQTTRQIYETLFAFDENRTLSPWLAEKWEYENDVTLVVSLRKGVKFHNGDTLKASDVLFSLQRVRLDNTPGAALVSRLDFDKSKVIDDYTLKLVTTEPYALQLPMLESPLCAIINERSYKESNKDFNKAPVGTGPYKAVQFRPGDSLRLEAFDQYWIPGQPYVKTVTIRYIADSSSRAMEAESGGSDIVYEINANDIDRIRANPDINLVSGLGAITFSLTFNQRIKPFDDIRVRQAIWYALDIPQAVKVAYGNYGQLASGMLAPGIDGRHPDLAPFLPKHDIAKAKSLLKEAGYENGFETEYMCMDSDQQRKDLGELMQAQLAKVGIKLKIKVVDSTTFASTITSSSISAWGQTASTGEAGRVLFRWLPTMSEYPIFSWNNQEYFDTINKALATVDREARNKLYYKCQEMLMQNYVVLPYWHKELNAACTLKVRGFRLMPSYEHHLLQHVYFVK